FVIRTERAPAGRRRRGEERGHNLSGAHLVCFWSEANPRRECFGHSETGFVVQYSGPAIGETLGELAHEMSAYQSRDLIAPLCLVNQPTEQLHCVEVATAKVCGQRIQRGCRLRFGKGSERSVAALTDPLIQAGHPVATPRTSLGHGTLPEVKFI